MRLNKRKHEELVEVGGGRDHQQHEQQQQHLNCEGVEEGHHSTGGGEGSGSGGGGDLRQINDDVCYDGNKKSPLLTFSEVTNALLQSGDDR